ncbi:MAG: alpha-galactosidase [Anaerolineae bacterium]
MTTNISSLLTLSTTALDFVLHQQDAGLAVERYAAAGQSWQQAQAEGALFAATLNGERYSSRTLTLNGVEMDYATAGVQHLIAHFAGSGFTVDHHLKVYQDTALTESWQVIRCTGNESVRVTQVDSVTLDLPAEKYQLLYYTSDWGSEFEPVEAALEGEKILETRLGRSSKGMHPWFALTHASGAVLSGSVAWSGNWTFRFTPLPNGGWRLSGGLHEWEFAKELTPGSSMETPPVVLAAGLDLNAVSQQYARVGRKHWYPRNALSALAPVEWNHWWAYEDDHINESVFMENTNVALERGVEICMLDAGWFGPSDPGSFWYDYRGDWDVVNTARFPNGVRPLSDNAHAKGMKFGMWCEIEALGEKAQLAQDHPELVALRDGTRLGYVCFGNPQTQEWAYQTLARLIRENDLDWIKLDFNLDPGAGCNRSDHGHGTGDGLYEHYMGYYRMLERIRADFPHVVLENCSSGGLRIDLGIMRRLDMTFLSDPDWAPHNLQLFWGVSTMLAPDSALHWSFSDWVGKNPPPYQNFNPRDPKLKPHQFDYYTRTSMLNVYGFSQKLIELPAWVEARLDHHTSVYKSHVRRFVKHADVYRLTEQPRRNGSGDGWAAFQYRLPDATEHLLFVFRLPGAIAARTITLCDLQPERFYKVVGFEGEDMGVIRGDVLMQIGLHFDNLPEEGSALLRVL